MVVVAILASIGGGTYVGYIALKGRVDRLQAGLTTDLQTGQRELEAGKASLQEANTKHDAGLIGQATVHFVAAKSQFQAAAQLADNSQLLGALEQLPAVGPLAHSRHVAISGIAEMGIAISDAGQGLADLDAQLIKPPAAGQAGRNLLTVLDQARAGLPTIRSDLERAQNAAAQVDVTVLPAPQQPTFTKAVGTIASALAGLNEFDRLVPVLEEMLGGSGSRTYLIEQVNPAELRGGGGFIGSYSLIRADKGTFKLVHSGDSYDLANPRPLPGQPGFIWQPDPLREVIPDTSWSFVDSNPFPDFPSSAKAAENFAEPRLGTKIDAVLSIDYYAVASMLGLTGPLAIPGFGVTVDANSLVPQLIQREADPTHKALLQAIAGPLMELVTGLPPDRWPALLAALNSLAAQHHLQAFFNNGLAQQEIERFGWSGELNTAGAADYVMEVESNYGGTKANYFLSRHYTLVLSRTGNLLHHVLSVDLTNQSPYNSYPDGLVYYRPYMRLYIPANASSVSTNLGAAKFSSPDIPPGVRLLDGWLPDISCCGGHARAVFQYDTPWPVRSPSRVDIYWQKQPGTNSDKVDVTWNDGSSHSYSISGSLSEDRIISVAPSGVSLAVGHSAQAVLPSLGLG